MKTVEEIRVQIERAYAAKEDQENDKYEREYWKEYVWALWCRLRQIAKEEAEEWLDED